MKKNMRLLCALTLSFSALTGCASTSQQTGGTTAANPEDHVVQDNAASEAVVMMADGAQPIPTGTRFATLDFGYLENFLDLGVLPVAGPVYQAPEDVTSLAALYYLDGPGRLYEAGAFDEVAVYAANGNEINYEQLLALDLDFIITSESNLESAERLNRIAPTYFMPNALNTDAEGNKDWKATHRLLGQIIGAEAEAEADIAEYEALLSDYKARITEKFEGEMPSAFVTQISTKGVQFAAPSAHQQIFAELGFTSPALPSDGGTIAIEGMVEINPDYIFANIESTPDFDVYKETPIWKNLTAVQNGNVFEFSHHVWNRSNSSMANKQQLIDACEFILNGTQVTIRSDLN